MMTSNIPFGPGKAYRTGISLIELFDMFPDEESAHEWFESIRWADGERQCPRCWGDRTREVPNRKPMPYWCTDCRQYFSVKTGASMERSKIPLRKWVIGIYLMTTSLKGVSSMKLHRDLKISQSAAWFMAQRIREEWRNYYPGKFEGPVEADETYIDGKPRNKGKSKRGRGTDKVPVVGIRDRATNTIDAMPVENVGKKVLHKFVQSRTYTDEWLGYRGVSPFHETVNHSAGEYVRDQVHVNGLESFWGLMKRGYHGVYHKMSKRHLHRYVREFAGRHNDREHDTIVQMTLIALRMVSRRLTYEELTAD